MHARNLQATKELTFAIWNAEQIWATNPLEGQKYFWHLLQKCSMIGQAHVSDDPGLCYLVSNVVTCLGNALEHLDEREVVLRALYKAAQVISDGSTPR